MGRLNKTKWCLLGCLIVIFVLVVCSILLPRGVNNTLKWIANSDFACMLRGTSGREAIQTNKLTEMVVETIGISMIDSQPVVILKEKDGDIYIPIWVGPLEADAIAVALQDIEVLRPLTADLLCSTLNAVNANIDYIVINDLKDQTFYANITIYDNWTKTEIDARPSDAIAVSLRLKTPIYVENSVLEKAGVRPDEETDNST